METPAGTPSDCRAQTRGRLDVDRTSRDSIIRRLEFARTELGDLGEFSDLEFSRAQAFLDRIEDWMAAGDAQV